MNEHDKKIYTTKENLIKLIGQMIFLSCLNKQEAFKMLDSVRNRVLEFYK